MRTWMLIGAGAGAVLLGYGLLRGVPEAKALEPVGAVPEAPDLLPRHDTEAIPTHTQEPDDKERERATYCQLLTAYRADLRKWQAKAAAAKTRMSELERLGQAACRVYAQTPRYKYHCNGFPVCGWNEWYTIEGTERDQEAYTLCTNAIKGGVELPSRKLPARSKLSSTGKKQLEQMNAEIATARAQVLDLRQKWAKQKAALEEANAQIAELTKKIKDLEAQGVFC